VPPLAPAPGSSSRSSPRGSLTENPSHHLQIRPPPPKRLEARKFQDHVNILLSDLVIVRIGTSAHRRHRNTTARTVAIRNGQMINTRALTQYSVTVVPVPGGVDVMFVRRNP
jgi:hypothetical protein